MQSIERLGLSPHQARTGDTRVGNATEQTGGFVTALGKADRNLVFSAHARSRLASRGIEMTDDMLDKLDKAVSSAGRKGSRDSLVLLSNLAFVVNVPNRTVVTAMDGTTMKDNIITNIDSTVLAG